MKFKKMITAAVAAMVSATAWSAAPRYVFYFIGDGMGWNEVQNAQLFNKHVLKSETPLLMTTFPVVSLATTYSASSDVTDSAAAGTALATGHKTRNAMLGMDADSVAVTSIAKYLHDDGYGVALVTSVAIDDATPGAFYTHVPHRNMFREIGRDLAESGYEFAAGSGLRGTKDAEGNDNGLLGEFAANGVAIAYGMDQLDKESRRVLLLSPFHEERNGDIGYTVDSIPGALTLPGMTAAAMEHMMRVSPDRFFMMVEGGNIDHAGHGNDGGTSVREVHNFNEAIAHAYNFYLAHPDETLIVVTADHETGGMSVGNATTGYNAPVWVAAGQKVSKELFNDYCKSVLRSRMNYTWDDMQQYLADNMGFWSAVPLSDGETAELKEMFTDIFEKRNAGVEQHTLYASFNGFAGRVFDLLNKKAGFGWTTPNHTGSPVPVFAVGVGAEEFTPLNDNTQLPRKIMKILGKEMAE